MVGLILWGGFVVFCLFTLVCEGIDLRSFLMSIVGLSLIPIAVIGFPAILAICVSIVMAVSLVALIIPGVRT